jgi:flavin-dependent dehydrogenase
MGSNSLKTGRQKYAIIVVGAGPAGLSTALHLTQIAPDLIPRMLILEKAHHPRHKLCGGGLLPDAELTLHQLGLDVTEIPHVDVDWAHFDFEGKGFKMRPDPGRSFAFRVIRRHEFDAWLAQKARGLGIEIREGVAVKAIHNGPTGVSLETDAGTFSAQVVVGADGSGSLVRQAVIPHEDSHTARLLEIITEPRPEHSFHIQTDSYFDFMYLPQGILGYTWDFPALENSQPVRVRGIFDSNVHPRKTDVSLRDALADEFHRHGYELGDYKLEGHPLRWFEPKSAFCAPRILLVGDAAGADALFGEGISIALGYGSIAASSIQAAFANDDFSFGDYKTDLLQSEMGKALRRRTWWARFFYRLRWRRIQSLVWHHLGPIIEWIMDRYLIGWARRQERKTT